MYWFPIHVKPKFRFKIWGAKYFLTPIFFTPNFFLFFCTKFFSFFYTNFFYTIFFTPKFFLFFTPKIFLFFTPIFFSTFTWPSRLPAKVDFLMQYIESTRKGQVAKGRRRRTAAIARVRYFLCYPKNKIRNHRSSRTPNAIPDPQLFVCTKMFFIFLHLFFSTLKFLFFLHQFFLH